MIAGQSIGDIRHFYSSTYLYVVGSDAPAPPHLWNPTRPHLIVFKIGITASIPSRLRRLKNASAYSLQLLEFRSLPTRQIAAKIEKTIHRSLANRRLNGEWFYDDVIGAICDIDTEICDFYIKSGMYFSETEKMLTASGITGARDVLLSHGGALA